MKKPFFSRFAARRAKNSKSQISFSISSTWEGFCERFFVKYSWDAWVQNRKTFPLVHLFSVVYANNTKKLSSGCTQPEQWSTQTSKVVCDDGGTAVFYRLVSQESTEGNSTRKYLCMREIGKSKWLRTSKKVVSKQTNWRISGRTVMLADSLRCCVLQGTSSVHTKFGFNPSCCDEIVSARKLRRTFLGLGVFGRFGLILKGIHFFINLGWKEIFANGLQYMTNRGELYLTPALIGCCYSFLGLYWYSYITNYGVFGRPRILRVQTTRTLGRSSFVENKIFVATQFHV